MATLAKSIWMTAAIDIKDPLFWGFIAAVAFNPLFWNWAARSEFKHKTISSSVLVRFTHKKLFSASKSPISINTWGCYLLALAIFLLGLVRDWFFKLAMDAQPKVRSLPQLAIRLFTLAAPTLAGKDHFQLDSLSSETLDQLDWWTLAYGINFILFGNILVLSSMYKVRNLLRELISKL